MKTLNKTATKIFLALVEMAKRDSIVIPYSFRNDYVGIDRTDILIEENKLKGLRPKQ